MNMDMPAIYTILVTIITVLGSTSAWRYYERKSILKEKSENFLKDDCRDRIIKLEALLERSSTEKDNMRSEILKLTSEVSELRTKVQYLEEENEELHRLRKKIMKKTDEDKI